MALASTLQDLVDLLSLMSFDNGAALQEPSTPQNNALLWLSNNINLDTYSDEKRIQRYALATFFYSTNGDNWKRNTGWITDGTIELTIHFAWMVSWCNLNFMIVALKVATMLLVQSQMSSHCYQILLVTLILAMSGV